MDPQLFLDTAVCNVTSVPVMGAAFKPTADLMQALSKITADIFVDAGAQNVNNYFTFLRYFSSISQVFLRYYSGFLMYLSCVSQVFLMYFSGISQVFLMYFPGMP